MVVHLEQQLAGLVLLLRLILFHQQLVVVVAALNQVLQLPAVQAVVVVGLQTLQALLELLGKEMLVVMVKQQVSHIAPVAVVEQVQ
jgi:hypothetical protein